MDTQIWNSFSSVFHIKYENFHNFINDKSDQIYSIHIYKKLTLQFFLLIEQISPKDPVIYVEVVLDYKENITKCNISEIQSFIGLLRILNYFEYTYGNYGNVSFTLSFQSTAERKYELKRFNNT